MTMSTLLAWKNLAHNKVRSGAAVAGVMFAVVLIFLQLGFLGATTETASRIYDVLQFDVLIRSQRTRRLAETVPFPRNRLDLAASAAGEYPKAAAWRTHSVGYMLGNLEPLIAPDGSDLLSVAVATSTPTLVLTDHTVDSAASAIRQQVQQTGARLP